METPDNTWGLPRDLIPWGPTIDPGPCHGSGECVRFCPNNVYEHDTPQGPARVAHFHQCTVLCNNCVAVCPNGAISFPDEDTCLDTVSEIRKRIRTGADPTTH